jgi:hypothetical protein
LLAKPTPRNVNLGSVRFSMFNKERDVPGAGTLTEQRKSSHSLAFTANHKFIGAVDERCGGKVSVELRENHHLRNSPSRGSGGECPQLATAAHRAAGTSSANRLETRRDANAARSAA